MIKLRPIRKYHIPQFRENLKQFGPNPDLIIFKNVNIRGTLGRVHFCEETGRVLARQKEDPNAGKMTKAQPISELQINNLRVKID